MRGACLLLTVLVLGGCRRSDPPAPPPLPEPPRIEATWIRNGERLTVAVATAGGGGTSSARLGRRSLVLTVTTVSPAVVDLEAVEKEDAEPRPRMLRTALRDVGLGTPGPIAASLRIAPPTDPSYPYVGTPNRAMLDLRGGRLRRELIAAGAVIDELELHWVPR